MAGFSSVTAAVAVAVLALVAPAAAADLVRHEWHEPQQLAGWQQRDRLAPDARLPMRIGFAHRPDTVAAAHDLLMDKSNPLSAQYGKHLSVDEVTDMFAPSSDVVDDVTAWVVDGGIAAERISVSANKQWLQFEARVDEAESLLNTVYYHYEHTDSGIHLPACPEYHVPDAVHRHIDYITPGVKLASYGFGEHVKAKRHAKRQAKRSTVVDDVDDTTGPHADAFVKEVFDDILDDIAHVFAALAPEAAATTNGSTTANGTAKATPPWIRGGCERSTTLDCIRKQYGVPLPAAGQEPVAGNEIGIFQTLSQHYSQADLDLFFSYESSGIPVGTAPELRSVDGAFGPIPVASSSSSTTTATATATTKGKATPVTTRPLSAGLEADLDLEIAMPLVYPQKAVLFQVDDEWYETTGATKYPGFLNTFFDAIDGSYCTFSAYGETGNCATDACRDPVYPNTNTNASSAYKGALMCGTYTPTNVIAISYSNEEHALPAAYIQRQCLEVLKLGLQGTTIVESAGDVGVGGGRGISANPNLGCLGVNRTVFTPRALSDCPYVLSVGATVLVNATTSATGFAEIAPVSFATGGGFSNVFGTPAWQQKAVDTYLATANLSFASYAAGTAYNLSTGAPQPPGLFNRSGRAYPDVSAVGDDVMVVYNGYGNSVAGTSVSTPIWGALLTLVNEERLRAGKTPVGFVNPVLYQHPEVFTDITVGSNPGCGSTGFAAAEGWDPVTGLGSPKFPKLLELFMGLP